MNYTDNLNLKKPEGTDVYNIENENDNMDIIDNTIHEHVELLGKTNEAGHVKIIDHLNKTAVANGEALSAHQGNVITTLLAPVEPTTTASRAYAIGEQFVLNGLLTEATAAISQGNTIVVGTGGNAKLAADVTSQLATIKSSLSNKQDKLTNPLTQSDVVNVLTSTSTVKPLSANQGKTLNDTKMKKMVNNSGETMNVKIQNSYVSGTTSSAGFISTGIKVVDFISAIPVSTGVYLSFRVGGTNQDEVIAIALQDATQGPVWANTPISMRVFHTITE